MKRWITTTIAALALVGCGGDDATGPSGGGITFPPIDQSILDQFCVRGQATIGETLSGTVAADDCDAAAVSGDDSYFETWRVRVDTVGVVTFDASSSFDNFLEVYRIDSIQGDTLNVTLIAVNDDRAPGNLNALVSVSLQPGIDYVVVVSGFDYSQTGAYTVEIR